MRLKIMVIGLVVAGWGTVWAGRLQCPDSPDGIHTRDIVATSAPEIKASQASKDDTTRWNKIIHPLTLKAIKLAKAQRASVIEDGIEQSCPANLVYVAQLLPFPDKPSGCDHRIVTRPGDNGGLFVQVIATCRYTWSCCSPEEARSSKPSPVSYKLEGPLNPTPSANDVTPAPSTAAPSKPVKK
jgi:hypothetical protein